MKSKNGKATFPKGMKVSPARYRKQPIPKQPTKKVGAGRTAPEGHNVELRGCALLRSPART